MQVEQIDMSEFNRRLELGIYDHDEFERAIKWVEKIKEGRISTESLGREEG